MLERRGSDAEQAPLLLTPLLADLLDEVLDDADMVALHLGRDQKKQELLPEI